MGGLAAATIVLKQQQKFAGLILSAAAIDVEWTPVMKCVLAACAASVLHAACQRPFQLHWP